MLFVCKCACATCRVFSVFIVLHYSKFVDALFLNKKIKLLS